MDEALFFEQLSVGDCFTSRGRTITETDVVNFAGMTGDFDPLHVDHEFAAQTPFKGPIAHGLLGLSFAAGLSSQCPPMQTVAFLAIKQWEFLRPLRIGDTVHVETEVAALSPHGRRRGCVTWLRRLINHENEIVQQGVFETLVLVGQKSVKPRVKVAAATLPPLGDIAHNDSPQQAELS